MVSMRQSCSLNSLGLRFVIIRIFISMFMFVGVVFGMIKRGKFIGFIFYLFSMFK